MAREFEHGQENNVVVLAVAKGNEDLFITLVDNSPLPGRSEERFIPFYTGEFKKDFVFKQALEDCNFKYLAMWVKTNLDQEHNKLNIKLCPRLQPYVGGVEYNVAEVKDVRVLFADKNETEMYVTIVDDDENTDNRRTLAPIYTGVHTKTHQFRYAVRQGNFGALAMWVKDNIREDFHHITIKLTPSLQKVVRRRG